MIKDLDLKEHLKRAVEGVSDNACTILITCENPTGKGKMQVEMRFDGDIDLAALLLDNAQSYFDQDENLSS